MSSALDPNGNFVFIANNQNNGNSDIFLSCIHPNGNVVWQQNCNTPNQQNDYGVDMQIDASGNIYITGAFHNGNNYDYFIAKYNQAGVLLWQKYYNNGKDDIPSALTLDGNGNVSVTDTSFGFLLPDIATVKYSSNGTLLGVRRLDYLNQGKAEAAVDIAVDQNNNIFIAGTWANNITNAHFLVAKYNSSGNLITAKTFNSPGTGQDAPRKMAVDNAGNVYVTGFADQNGNKNARTLKLDNSLNLLWDNYIDATGNIDEAFDLQIAPNGNIAITGFCETSTGNADFNTTLYDAAGNTLWQHNRPCEQGGLAKGKSLFIDANNNVLVAGDITQNGKRQYRTARYSPKGEIQFEKLFALNSNANALDVVASGSNVYVLGEANTGTATNFTAVNYTLVERSFNADTTGIPHADNELIIRFGRDALIYPNIDDLNFEAGPLAEFVTQQTIQAMQQRFDLIDWNVAPTFKIHRNLTSKDTISISRSGKPRRIPEFWATLLVQLPNGFDEQTIADTLTRIGLLLEWAEINSIPFLTAVLPNDTLLPNHQASLVPNSTYNYQLGIRADSAWMIEHGEPYTRVGVIDNSIYWAHEDFGDGTFNGSKIKGGFNYNPSFTPIANYPNPSGSHGTAVAGIIGALRNNTKGIAGIAGGDVADSSNTGCSLFSFGTFGTASPNIADFVQAIQNAAADTTTLNGLGVNIINNSWAALYTSSSLRNSFKEAIGFASNQDVTVVNSRGNFNGITNEYPAGFDDRLGISVGSFGLDGKRKIPSPPNGDLNGSCQYGSSYGNDMDCLAPGITELITAPIYPPLIHDTCQIYTPITPKYSPFSGTSSAAPHISGIAALLHSHHHTLKGAPVDLNQYDIENIIQNSCTPNGQSFLEAGHGKVNAALALKRVDFPNYYVYHSTQPAPTITIDTSLLLYIDSCNLGFYGNYIADRYKLEYQFNVTLPPTHEIFAWWESYSHYTEEVGFINAQQILASWNGGRFANYYPPVQTAPNQFSIKTETWIWYIKNQQGNTTPINSFIPKKPAEILTPFGLHVKNNALTGINRPNQNFDFSVYPNPVKEAFNLQFTLENTANISIEIIDLAGKRVYSENYTATKGNNLLSISTSNLSKGVYSITLRSTKFNATKKLMKL